MKKYKDEVESYISKSLEHFEKTLQTLPENYEIHKMKAFANITLGIENYQKALDSIDIFINLLNNDVKGIEESLEKRKKEKEEPEISQKKMESLDTIIASLEGQIKQNRKEYQAIQEMASNLSYQLAILSSKKARESESPEDAEKFRKQIDSYMDDSAKRLELILEISPNAPTHYKNLAYIFQVKGDYGKAAKYLQEYLRKYPLDNAKSRVEAKLELENLQKQGKIEVPSSKDVDKKENKEIPDIDVNILKEDDKNVENIFNPFKEGEEGEKKAEIIENEKIKDKE